MSDEQHEQPEEKPNKGKSLFSFFWPRKLNGNKDRSYPDQQGAQPAPIQNGVGGFIKDYGFQVLAILINAILAFYTANLYKTAVSQSQSASISAQAAKDAVAEYKRSNDLAKAAAQRNTEYSERMFGLSVQALEAQISSDKSTQNRFAIQNEPYIQCIMTKITPLVVGKPVQFKYAYLNFGIYPAKTLSEKLSSMFSDKDPSFKEIMDSGTEGLAGKYIVNGIPDYRESFGTAPIPENVNRGFLGKRIFLYVATYVVYQNLVSRKVKHYRCLIRIDADPDNSGDYLLNDNEKGK